MAAAYASLICHPIYESAVLIYIENLRYSYTQTCCINNRRLFESEHAEWNTNGNLSDIVNKFSKQSIYCKLGKHHVKKLTQIKFLIWKAI